MILLIVFVVCMLLWLIGAIWPQSPGRPAWFGTVSGIVPWIAVLCLFLMGHGARIL